MLSFAIFALPTLSAAEMPKEFLAVYSNMCVSPHSGDLRGERMIVYRTGYQQPADKKEQIWVLHQRSEGVLWEPIFERVAIEGDDIRFVLHFPPPSNFMRTFVGKITPAAISGRYTDSNGSHPVMLPRETHAENSFPECAGKAGPSGGTCL
jgi:hypothetical protein